MPAKKTTPQAIDHAAAQADLIPFIKALTRNNNREWFAEHKPRYDTLRAHLEVMTDRCLERMRKFDPELAGLTAKRCMYRIYRDTRFSHDKTPYKRHIGIFINKGGIHGENAGYYMHFEPGNCFMGAGVYGLQPDSMKKVRQHIYYRCADFKKIVLNPKLVKIFGELDQEGKMKMPPKGFDKDFPDIEWLKYRYYFFMKPFTDKQAGEVSIFDEMAENMRILHPFTAFLNEGLSF